MKVIFYTFCLGHVVVTSSYGLFTEMVACKILFPMVAQKFLEPSDYVMRLPIAALRAKIAKDPNYEPNVDEQLLIRNHSLTKNFQELRDRSLIDRWFRSYLDSTEALRKESYDKENSKLINKILSSPEVVLSPEERRKVDRDYRFGKNAEVIRAISRVHGKTIKALRALSKVSRTLAGAIITAGILQTYVGYEEDDEKNLKPLAPDEFEIVFRTVHTSIRIGNDEYDYMITEARKNALDDAGHRAEGKTRIRIKVTKEEVAKLKAFLESEVGARGLYYITPHFTSCASQINRAVERNTSFMIPAGIDRSPAVTAAYLKIKRFTGDSRVKSITYYPGEKKNLVKPLWDAGDSILTGLFFVDFAVAAQLDRTPWGYSLYFPDKEPAK